MDAGVELNIDNSYRTVCSTCLSGDRNLFLLNAVPQIYHVFRLLMYDFAGDRVSIYFFCFVYYICFK